MQPLNFSHTFDKLFAANNMTATRACGIVPGRDTMRTPEFNNMPAVIVSLNRMVRHRSLQPAAGFYDLACKLWEEMILSGLYWRDTSFYVDKFHFVGHSVHDNWCQQYCNPNKEDDPLLYRTKADGSKEFMWKTSRAEVTNAWMAGFSHIGKVSCVAWHDIWLNHMVLAHNELFLDKQINGTPAERTDPKWYSGRGSELI